jgi:hypothetical protein
MKKTVFFVLLSLCALPSFASAHERGIFEIGGSFYQFVIGSQGEPVMVDDKSGLDLRVTKLVSATATSGTPVAGLEKTLQLEISAEGQKRVQAITAVYGQVGAYNSLFFPTKSTILTYRVFGSIDGSVVNLSFTCHKGEHVMGGSPDTVTKDMGGGITRHMQAGMFSCPSEKEQLGFPVRSAHMVEVAGAAQAQGALLATVNREFRFVEIALGLLVVAFAAIALSSNRRKTPPVA